MKITILLVAFVLVVEADLLDLYVQHMDETMGTNANKRHHPRDIDIKKSRNKRSVNEDIKFGNYKKQSLDVDDDWWIGDKKSSKKPQLISKTDGLEHPNIKEEYHDPKFHEFLNDDIDIEMFENFLKKNSTDEEPKEAIPPHVNDNDNIDTTNDVNVATSIEMQKNNDSRIPKKFISSMKNQSVDKKLNRHKRNTNEVNFTRHEILDEDGDVILEWDPTDNDIVTFRVTAKTLGYIGIGFNDKNHMKGADIIITWVDDHSGTPNLLDSHGMMDSNASPITDISQDVKILKGSQNGTHTSVTFSRNWQTCDPDDYQLTEDNVRIIWALHSADPELNTPVWHGEKRGGRALRIRATAPKTSPPPSPSPDIRNWDVKLNQFAVDDKQDTIYWCKIFKAPQLNKKHHMIGYEPLVEKSNEGLVHHMILYECASTSPLLGQHARIAGAPCYSPTMPREWDSCIQPVVAWARGSRGEWFGDHVGIPVGEHKEGSYYMLEVHYNNPSLKKAIDSSGIRLHLTPNLRPQEAGIFVTGMAVSPLHLIPPKQKEYATAGYCTPSCTGTLFPEDGVNVVSVVLHSHMAGRKMSLGHVRKGQQLPYIVKENHFDFEYQQSYSLDEEVKILPGDELITECVYGTLDRSKPTLGGYSADQEMCLAFVLYYPKTELAGCYSMTPAKDLFKTLGVKNFKGLSLDNVEKLFLTTGTDAVTIPPTVQQQLPVYPATRPSEKINYEIIKEAESTIKAMQEFTEQASDDNVFARLVIEDPEEFRGRTLAQHMVNIPWTEESLTRSFENSLYNGRHMTFCRKRDDKLALPSNIQMFPNFTKLPEQNKTICSERRTMSSSTVTIPNLFILSYIFVISIYFCCKSL
ncbi:MOXD1 homolog 1 [Aphidius gifuensis]|uniref:MOXD1 homolog 1 n=1 Tax=Aphidius gifuensis TaxID=684658 RepID=UPI001CDC44EB|nr:MOXD1 homolog 1 [Aphidius gifuensis]